MNEKPVLNVAMNEGEQKRLYEYVKECGQFTRPNGQGTVLAESEREKLNKTIDQMYNKNYKKG